MSNEQPKNDKLISDVVVPILFLLAAAFFTWMLVKEANFPPVVRAVVFCGLCAATLLRQRWVIYGVMAISLVALSNGWRGVTLLPQDIYLVFVLLGYAVVSLRYTDLDFKFRRSEPSANIDVRHDSDKTWLGLRPFTAGWVWIPVAMVLALFVLWIVPYDPSTDERLRIKPTGFRAIAILWFLALGWFLLSGVFLLTAGREKDPLRALVFLLDQFIADS